MRKWMIILVAAAQVALLAFMAGQREWVARTGRTVWLRTMPLDPNDPMRGAYVRLNYELSTVTRELCRDGLAKWMDERAKGISEEWRVSRRKEQAMRDRLVFAVLQVGPHGLAELVALTDREPASGLYVRGRVSSIRVESVTVRYGVEALFLQQNKAKQLELEAGRRGREDGVVMDAEVAVSAAGMTVLKGYRWEPLGLTLTTETAPVPPVTVALAPETIVLGAMMERAVAPRRDRPVVAVTVELKNHGDRPVAIFARGGRSFRLVPGGGWGGSSCRWAGADRPRPRLVAEDILILKPGEGHKVRLDLTAPEWAVFVRKDEKGEERKSSIPALLDDDQRGWSFRIEYVPPTPDECAGLPGAQELWFKEVRSRAFFPNGGGGD